MEVTKSAVGLWEACEKARQAGSSVGFVPTMGALHEGHHALVNRARSECRFVVLSIFVNPLQFGEAADFARYPRPLGQDLELAEEWSCELAFVPDHAEMYPGGPPQVAVDPGPLGERLEGASRSGHFRGVLTVVAKLLNLVGPCRAYFGQKDAQQLALVRRMVADLNLAAEIVPIPIVRDNDGLALSSRNVHLSQEERKAALSLVRALGVASQLAKQGHRSAALLKAEMAKRIGAEPLARLDYVAVVDDQTWEEAEEIHAPARALVAARFGRTRLIDNLLLPWKAVPSTHDRLGHT
jgi:pantoate--beta-alanine ligase